MALFGADFDPGRPSDGDFCRATSGPQMGTALRDLKFRIKAFSDKAFFLESGLLKDSVVPPRALRSLSPPPQGSWNLVSVNAKGLVEAGQDTALLEDGGRLAPRIFRACFFGSTSMTSFRDDLENIVPMQGEEGEAPGDGWSNPEVYQDTGKSWQYLTWEFPVPERVRSLRLFLTGGNPVSGDPIRSKWTTMPLASGQTVRVYAGLSPDAPSRVWRSDGVYVDNTDHAEGLSTAAVKVPGPVYSKFGGDNPSLVILEWYA